MSAEYKKSEQSPLHSEQVHLQSEQTRVQCPLIIAQLPRESSKAYERFLFYFNLGAGRSLRAVSRQFNVGVNSIFMQSERYEWNERIRTYENEEVRIRTEARQAAIAKAETHRTLLEENSRDRTLLETCRIAYSSLKQVMSWNDSGITLKNSDEVTDDAAAAIQEVAYSFDKMGNPVKKVRMHNKMAAIMALGEHHKLWGKNEEPAGQTINNYMILVKAVEENPRFREAILKAEAMVLEQERAERRARGEPEEE